MTLIDNVETATRKVVDQRKLDCLLSLKFISSPISLETISKQCNNVTPCMHAHTQTVLFAHINFVCLCVTAVVYTDAVFSRPRVK